MRLFSGRELEAADARHFVGTARVTRMPVLEKTAKPEQSQEPEGQQVIVYLVDFEPGARTNWHRHSAPQLLLVQEGRGLVQVWGEPVRHIAAGDAVSIEPGEKHWHGAAPGSRMAHFAVNLNLTTDWLEPVSDDQYRAS